MGDTCRLQVPGGHGIVELAMGGAHTLALRQTDDMLAWGANENGVLGLGIGTSQDAKMPTRVPKLTCCQVCCIPGHALLWWPAALCLMPAVGVSRQNAL